MRPYLAPLSSLALFGAFPAALLASEPVQVVYTIFAQAPTSPRSAIPGTIPGNPTGDLRFTNFNNKIYRSPTTNQWLVVATTNLTPASQDQVLLVGSGLSGAVAAREGVTSPAAGEFLNYSLLSVPRINDSGQWAMGYRNAGGTANDDRLAIWDGANFTLVKGGDAIAPSAGGGTYTGSFNGANIANSGAVGYLAAISTAAATAESVFTSSGATLLINIGVTIPTGQSAAIPTPLTDVTANAFYQDASGSHSIVLGKVGADVTIDVVAVVDGAVVIQKGSIIPGMSPASPVSAITDVWMESNADWFARGTNADATTWIVRNGAVIAQTGRPIFPGSSELWESFRDVKGNNTGHWVISGNTNNATTLIDDVLVFNGTRVVARESDPVDLNANGQFEGSLFVHLIQNNDTYNNDGYYYFASRLKDSPTSTAGAGGSNNASLLRVHICPADFDGNGGIEPADIAGFVNTWFQSLVSGTLDGDFDHNNAVQPADVAVFVTAWFNALSGFCQ